MSIFYACTGNQRSALNMHGGNQKLRIFTIQLKPKTIPYHVLVC